jgi:ABC-type bacteriocin/lantibiotic exporter with double-glycine peptidase domain
MSENAPLSAQITRFRQMEVGRELFGGSLATSLIDLPFTVIFFTLIFALGGTLGFVPVAFGAVLLLVGLCTTPGLSKQMRDMGDWKAKSDSRSLKYAQGSNSFGPTMRKTSGSTERQTPIAITLSANSIASSTAILCKSSARRG